MQLLADVTVSSRSTTFVPFGIAHAFPLGLNSWKSKAMAHSSVYIVRCTRQPHRAYSNVYLTYVY